LFDEVIHVRPGTEKSAYIADRNALLLDDSFSERLEVAATLGISTFDCSMIEMLIEESSNVNVSDARDENVSFVGSSQTPVTSLD
jgi:hypothetical protein